MLKISEIFYSLQGEGHRTGEASLFVRLQGCSVKHACFKSGVICDTEFESGQEFSIDYVLDYAKKVGTKWITWTGGEPTDQLTDEICLYVKKKGYKQSIVKMEEIGPDDINKYNMFIKFYCTPSDTI